MRARTGAVPSHHRDDAGIRAEPRDTPYPRGVLLALDTSSPTVAVALHDDGGVLLDLVSERPMKHAEQLAPLVEEVLARTGTDRHDLTAIAVGVGPGPFTGLRVGLVTARTLAFVLQVPVYGVCSLDVVAVQALAEQPLEDAGGSLVVATDARRKEVYLARYDAGGARLEGPVVDKPAVLATDLPVAGEGALLYPDSFPHARGPARPSAGWLARCVAEELVELHDPDPLYLRRPDAVGSATPKRVS